MKQFSLATVTVTAVGSEVTLATVPAGYRWVLRDITARNLYGAGVNNLYVYIRTSQIIFYPVPVSGSTGTTYQWQGWIVLEPGDTIRARVGNAAGISLVVSGSQYTI